MHSWSSSFSRSPLATLRCQGRVAFQAGGGGPLTTTALLDSSCIVCSLACALLTPPKQNLVTHPDARSHAARSTLCPTSMPAQGSAASARMRAWLNIGSDPHQRLDTRVVRLPPYASVTCSSAPPAARTMPQSAAGTLCVARASRRAQAAGVGRERLVLAGILVGQIRCTRAPINPRTRRPQVSPAVIICGNWHACAPAPCNSTRCRSTLKHVGSAQTGTVCELPVMATAATAIATTAAMPPMMSVPDASELSAELPATYRLGCAHGPAG